MNILIVEDEALNACLMQFALQRSGHRIAKTVASGEDALDFVLSADAAVDLVLMDICLDGELDGIETVTKIHEKKRIPVIYVTASTDGETFSRAQKTEMRGYLKKPYLQEELLRLVQGVESEGMRKNGGGGADSRPS